MVSFFVSCVMFVATAGRLEYENAGGERKMAQSKDSNEKILAQIVNAPETNCNNRGKVVFIAKICRILNCLLAYYSFGSV
jgi:hypothetical protein